MVKRKVKLFLFLIFMLISCSSYKFIEKEDYEFDYDKFIPLIKDSISNIEERYNKFNSEMNIRDENYSLTLYPMNDRKIEIIDSWKEKGDQYLSEAILSHQKISSPYFKREDGYYLLTHYFMNNNIMIWIDKEYEQYKFKFTYTIEYDNFPSSVYGPYPYNINSIEYNDIYAYQLVFNESESMESIYELIYLMANTEELKYDIYFVSKPTNEFYNFYMIPQNNKFSKKYIKYFNEDENLHYLDINKIRSMI